MTLMTRGTPPERRYTSESAGAVKMSVVAPADGSAPGPPPPIWASYSAELRAANGGRDVAVEQVERMQFYETYAKLIAEAYPTRPDGITLFPFRRLFIVARRT